MKKSTGTQYDTRKTNLEKRLHKYELENVVINIAAFDETQYDFVAPAEAAERMFILLAISFAAYNFEQVEKIMDWLKKEDLWKSVSDKEKNFFRDPNPPDEEKQMMSWRFEGAFIIAWSLGKVDPAPLPESELSEERVREFLEHVPAIGTSIDNFFDDLEFRFLPELLDESFFYQNATAYFKKILAEDKENTSPVHEKAAYERDMALRWLRDGYQQQWDSIG